MPTNNRGLTDILTHQSNIRNKSITPNAFFTTIHIKWCSYEQRKKSKTTTLVTMLAN